MGKGTPTNKIMRHSIKSYTNELLLAGIFMLTYTPTLLWMWDRWFARDSYYSHGILIPLVTGFLVWQRRSELSGIKHKRSSWGMPLIAGGLCIYLLSSLFRIYFTSAFSLLIVLTGMILFFYGTATLKKIVFPVCFLIFMVPAPLVVIANVSFKMKMFAAYIATWLLNNIGLPAVQVGSIIKMQHTYVVVDDVCSGLRSLIALMALGSIFAYWMKGPMSKRILLFCSTIPIAIVTNVMRIIFLSFIAEVWGPQYTAGFIHDLSGFMIFALAFVLLYAVGKLLE